MLCCCVQQTVELSLPLPSANRSRQHSTSHPHNTTHLLYVALCAFFASSGVTFHATRSSIIDRVCSISCFCSALIFGEDHPYANRIEESDYQRITVSLIRDFYHRYYQAGQFRIFICGHVNEGLLNTVTRLFGNLPIPSPGNISKKLPFHAAQPGRYHVSKENCVQSSIRIGKSSVRLTDDDYAGYMLLNTILGGYFGSRLMSNIREEKGYTYGIGSFNVSLPQRSYWSITTEVNNEYTEATIEEIFKEIHKLRTETVPAEELNLVKNYLYGDLLRELDGVFAQSDSLKHKLNYGLDNSFYIGIIEKIRQCTPEAILELADKYWNPEEMYIVTAGQP